MDMDFLKEVKEIKEETDDAKTAAEHTAIILRYKQTGCLDRDDAIKKYREFNDNHPDYYAAMRIATVSAGTAAYIDDVPDQVIVKNLIDQLFYLTGKNILEEVNHAQPTT